MFRWFFTSGSGWSDQARQRRWDEKADKKARQRARRQRQRKGKGKGLIYWE